MPVPDRPPPRNGIRPGTIDWRGWMALAWAAWFAILYSRMMLIERAPGLLRAVGRCLNP